MKAMAILRARLSRRTVLGLGTTGVGLALLAGATCGARAVARSVAPGMRPGARAGSGTICALCGEASHAMLGGPHGLAARRRR
jgi:hypothetical protein